MRWWPLLALSACGRVDFDRLPDSHSPLADSSTAIPRFAYWKFGDGAGTTAIDSSGNGHSLDLVGNPAWTTGMFGGAVTTNGVDQYLETAQILDLTATNAITVSLWLRYAYGGPGPYNNVFELTSNFNFDNGGFAMFADDTNDCSGADIGIGVTGDVGGSTGCYTPPSANTWHHFVVVFDKGLPGCCESAIYVDGVVPAGGSNNFADNSNSLGAAHLYLMSRGGAMAFAAGDIDELAIYSRALTPAEIASL